MNHHVDPGLGMFVCFKSTSHIVFVEGLPSIELVCTMWKKILLIKGSDFGDGNK